MLLLEKYEYSPIDRVTTIDRKRHYKLPDGSSVPSVTTILEEIIQSMSTDELEETVKHVDQHLFANHFLTREG